MTSSSVEIPVDDGVIALPRRRGPTSYSVHNGVGRTPLSAQHEAPLPRPSGRGRSRSPQAADIAQSQLFEALLLAEIDDLEDRAAVVERHRRRRADRNPGDAESLPAELTELRLRLVEARRLLHALRQRFPPD